MNEDGKVNEEKYDLLTRPVTAFITFNSDDGLNEALLYNKQDAFYRDSNAESGENFVHKRVLDVIPRFTQATDPTNIIWEHRHIKGVRYGARVASALLLAFFMLVVSFAVIINFKQEQIKNLNQFPPIKCDTSYDPESFNDEKLKQLAGFEFNLWQRSLTDKNGK